MALHSNRKKGRKSNLGLDVLFRSPQTPIWPVSGLESGHLRGHTARPGNCSGLPDSQLSSDLVPEGLLRTPREPAPWLPLRILLRCRACLLSRRSECECSSRGPAPAVLLWIKALLNSRLPGLQSKLQPCTIYLGKSRTRLMICKVDLLFGCLLWQLLKVLC